MKNTASETPKPPYPFKATKTRYTYMVPKINSNNFTASKTSGWPKPLRAYSDYSLASLKVMNIFIFIFFKN